MAALKCMKVLSAHQKNARTTNSNILFCKNIARNKLRVILVQTKYLLGFSAFSSSKAACKRDTKTAFTPF